MAKLKYNYEFKDKMFRILIIFFFFSFPVIFGTAEIIQYFNLVSGMKSTEANIINIELSYKKHTNVQNIDITYEIAGITYNRELGTDTTISSPAGYGTNYSVGDKVKIFYDPDNPEIIAVPQTVKVSAIFSIIGYVGLTIALYHLVRMLKNSRKYLITQEEYIKDKEELKKIREQRKNLRKIVDPKRPLLRKDKNYWDYYK